MPQSQLVRWIVGAGVLLVLGAAVAVSLWHHPDVAAQPTPAAGAQWRAQSDMLVQRVEQLAGAGEVDAAASVLEVLLKRPEMESTGFGDRARMAVARSYLAAGRRDQALAQVQAIPWADKGPQIAADIVGLELAVRWRGLFDDHQQLVSGALTPRNSQEAPSGREGGLWQDRWLQYRALATALDRGARMVAAEGGQVAMPASARLMQVARYSRGDGSLAALMTALGQTRDWDADLALTLVRLHLDDHDLDAALAAGEVLWAGHAQTTQAGAAFRDLRLWQLRRRAMSQTLLLWDQPLIDQRLDALAITYSAAASNAEAAVAQEREVNQAAMGAGMNHIVAKMERDLSISDRAAKTTAAVEDIVVEDNDAREWRLALTYDGLAFQADQGEVAAGTTVRFQLDSEHRGEHRVRLYRLADRAAWDALCTAPTRALLGEKTVADQVLELNGWASIGAVQRRAVEFPGLSEGFYAATVSARGCPVVVLAGVTVVDPDLHLVAGRAEILGWVVRRANGQGKAGEPISATIRVVRSAERAAGAAWGTAEPAWRSGFIEGFTGVPSVDFRRADQQADFSAGVTVGARAALADPPLTVELTGVSDAGGLVRLALPERARGRAYEVTARIARPQVMVQRSASFGEDAAWTSKAVVWADKPLARPGETVRFKALLRDFNGDGYRLPVGELAARVQLGSELLAQPTLALSDHGTVSGEVLIPPGAADGALTLVLGDGAPRHLARVERVRLPPLRFELIGLDAALQARAGESMPLTVRLRDRGGEPLAGIAVQCEVTALADGETIPCEQPTTKPSDLAGEVRLSLATAAEREADYHAVISFRYDGTVYSAAHDWRTRTFPFQLDAALRNRDLRVGGVAQIELRLPVDAEVVLQVVRAGRACGAPVTARGRWPAWTQIAVPIVDAQLGADALTISTAVLGGGTATRRLRLSVQPRQDADGSAQVALMPVRARVETGESLPLALGTSDPGRDLLVLGGARDLLVAQVERLDQSSKQTVLPVAGTWAPNIFLSAVAYLPGRGFVVSDRREVEVLPVDRLLKVSVQPARADYRPGEQVDAVVQVSDWRGQPVADCSLSLGVVNELVYQLAEDPTPDLWSYFHTYRRSWGLITGSADTVRFPQAMFWQSVAFRWQAMGSFMAFGRAGGGHRMASARGGGSSITTRTRALLQPEADATIRWVADLRTDAQGKASVRFPLPDHAGRFRCTARANDASAAVVVGEVRSVIASREPYACAIDLPDVVAAGDVVPAQVQVANHDDREHMLVLTLPDGSTRQLALAAHARRTLTMPVTIPLTSDTKAEVVRIGDQLGERLTFAITLASSEPGARVVSASTGAVRRLPGHPTETELRLVADAQGVLHLPVSVQPSAGVWLRLRAWPDAAARRAGALTDWRQRPSEALKASHLAMAWLLAEPGADRRQHLAQCWTKLGNAAADIVVKQAANRRGEADSGIAQVPDGVIGDWLLARGRAAGQTLPTPRRRGIIGSNASERAAAAATAIAEGWSEAPELWSAVQRELTQTPSTDVPPLAVALACDAARLIGDAVAGKRLAALLASLDWNDELVAVLAIDVLPERSEASVNQVVIASGGAESILPASVFAEWTGVAGGGFTLRSAPGAVVEADLIVQQSLPPAADAAPTIALWQDVGDGYEPVPSGQSIGPGRQLLLVIDQRMGSATRDVTVALPSLLRLGRSPGEVLLIDRREERWALGDDDRRVILELLQHGNRTDAITAFAAHLQRLSPTLSPNGRRLTCEPEQKDKSTTRGGALLRLSVEPGQCRAIALDTGGEGSCRWPGARIDDGQRGDARLVFASVGALVQAQTVTGHPLAKALIAAVGRASDDEMLWMIGAIGTSGRATIGEWQSVLRTLDPAAKHDLDELLVHPGLQSPGHWTHAQIRRWVDGEPLLAADAAQVRNLITLETPTLATLVELAVASRDQRRRAWFALPQPQPAPAVPLANLKRWYDRLVALGLITATDYRTWCWQQDLDPELLGRLGYADTLDAWVAFIRLQLELPLHIGAGVRTGSAVSMWVTLPGVDHTGQLMRREAQPRPGISGAHLGAAGLGDDLVVVTVGDAYELRPFLPLPQPRAAWLSIDLMDVPATDAVKHLSLLLANRGFPPVRFGTALTADELATLPPVTLRVDEMKPEIVIDFIAKLLGLRVVKDRNGTVLDKLE